MFIIIIFWLGCDRPSGIISFVPALLLSILDHALFLPSSSVIFILFHSCCSHARVFRKILLHEFPISYSHTEWYTFFFRFAYQNLMLLLYTIILLLAIILLQWYVKSFKTCSSSLMYSLCKTCFLYNLRYKNSLSRLSCVFYSIHMYFYVHIFVSLNKIKRYSIVWIWFLHNV